MAKRIQITITINEDLHEKGVERSVEVLGGKNFSGYVSNLIINDINKKQ